jgi:hypothetical protein
MPWKYEIKIREYMTENRTPVIRSLGCYPLNQAYRMVELVKGYAELNCDVWFVPRHIDPTVG